MRNRKRNKNRLALAAFLLLIACAGGRPPIDVQIRGGEHHFDWWLGVPF